MRKIVSFTILNNEADIIESFVRYNMTYIDKMIILDNGCTDNTVEILRLLKNEGYDIDIFDESLIDFEQFQIMNKYLRIVNEKYAPDIVIPLDADEFLTTEHETVRDILEQLPLDKVYRALWRTFVMSEDDGNSGFVCRDMKKSYLHKDGKVIIPANLIEKYQMILTVGQHNVVGKNGLEVETLSNLQMAHYPNRTIEQVKAKSLCHSVRYVNYLNRATGEGRHRNVFAKACVEHIDDFNNEWFQSIIMERMKTWQGGKIETRPVNLDSPEFRDIEIKYKNMGKINVPLNLYNLAKIMAIKAYNLRIQKKLVEAPTVLIYGTGNEATHLLDGFPHDLVNIRAYINSDLNLELTMFNGRLVISPKLIKFFGYDKIILASVKYCDEMREILLSEGIADEKICGAEYILNESIRQLGKK